MNKIITLFSLLVYLAYQRRIWHLFVVTSVIIGLFGVKFPTKPLLPLLMQFTQVGIIYGLATLDKQLKASKFYEIHQLHSLTIYLPKFFLLATVIGLQSLSIALVYHFLPVGEQIIMQELTFCQLFP